MLVSGPQPTDAPSKSLATCCADTGAVRMCRQDSARHLEELQRNFESTLAHMSSEPHTQARSAKLVERLKAKRLGQVFDYLVSAHPTDGEGSLDLGSLDPQILDTLDWEVRADVDAAVRLHEARVSRESGCVSAFGQAALTCLGWGGGGCSRAQC